METSWSYDSQTISSFLHTFPSHYSNKERKYSTTPWCGGKFAQFFFSSSENIKEERPQRNTPDIQVSKLK